MRAVKNSGLRLTVQTLDSPLLIWCGSGPSREFTFVILAIGL
jgi:hypothetical protein